MSNEAPIALLMDSILQPPVAPIHRGDDRASQSKMKMTAVTTTRMSVDTTASAGLTAISASDHKCRGRVFASPPVTKRAIVSSSNEVMNAIRKAARRPPRALTR